MLLRSKNMALGWRSQYSRYKGFFLKAFVVYKKRQDVRMFLEIILSMIAISFFASFALRPTVITISELVKEIKSKEQTVAIMDQKIQDLAAAKATFNRESARIPQVLAAVPDSPTPETFVRQIEGLAAKNSLSLLGISVEEVTLVGEAKPSTSDSETSFPQGARDLTFSANLSGSYPGLLTFLSDLEKLRRPGKIDTVIIATSEKDGVKILTIVVSGRTVYLDQNIKTDELVEQESGEAQE